LARVFAAPQVAEARRPLRDAWPEIGRLAVIFQSADSRVRRGRRVARRPNLERFCDLLDEMRRKTDARFVTIAHNPIALARMDRRFGVTETERSVSQLVSVDLEQEEKFALASCVRPLD
jgi:hypothetical protein